METKRGWKWNGDSNGLELAPCFISTNDVAGKPRDITSYERNSRARSPKTAVSPIYYRHSAGFFIYFYYVSWDQTFAINKYRFF